MFKVTIIDKDENRVVYDRDDVTVVAGSIAYGKENGECVGSSAVVLKSRVRGSNMLAAIEGLKGVENKIKKEHPEIYLFYELLDVVKDKKDGGNKDEK